MQSHEKKVHGGSGISGLSAALKSPSAGPSTARALSQETPLVAHQPTQHEPLYARFWPASVSFSAEKLSKSILPFWSCFSRVTGSGTANDARNLAVVTAEVGIRPSFYWLDADVSEEERMFAEANARWMKSDCQDDVVVLSSFANMPCQIFAGVFDGHGPYGRSAAKFASTRIPILLANHPAMASMSGDKKRLRAMREVCETVDSCMRDAELCGFDASLSGTTACFAVVCGRKVYLANTGDSRCVLGRRSSSGGTEAVQMTWDAKPDHPDELRRIRQAGGVVFQLLDDSGERVGAHRVFRRGDDVLPGLAMSRSLGDLYAHAVGVTSEPELSTYSLQDKDLFLVLGTDGIWDIMTNEEVIDFIERYRNGRAQDLSCAEALTLEAQERWKAQHEEALVDDISVAIIHMEPLGPVDRSAHVQSPLAHAASCNDEANALFRSWSSNTDCNPSNHAPCRYFSHLYRQDTQTSSAAAAAGEDVEATVGAGSPCSTSSRSVRRRQSEGTAIAAAAIEQQRPRVLPPVSSPSLRSTLSLPRDMLSAELLAEEQHFLAGAAPSSEQEQRRHGLSLLEVPGAVVAAELQPSPSLLESPSTEAMLGAASHLGAAEELSPRSSLNYSECSEHGHFSAPSSSKFSGAFARSPSVQRPEQLGTVRSSPIPCSSAGDLDPLFRPIRKAYPSQSGGLCSYKSNASMVDAQETPRSTEGGDSRGSAQSRNFSYEGKLRGGLPRTISAPILANAPKFPSSCEMPALSSSLHTVSLEDRGLAHLASNMTDSPTDSNLSSPYHTISPVGPPMVGFPPPLPPPFGTHLGGGPFWGKAGNFSQESAALAGERSSRGLLRSVSEVAEAHHAQRGGVHSSS